MTNPVTLKAIKNPEDMAETTVTFMLKGRGFDNEQFSIDIHGRMFDCNDIEICAGQLSINVRRAIDEAVPA